MCLLGNEQQLVWGCMRPSGDFGYLDDSGLFFEGRCDDQVKRAGHRINLSSIQQVLCKLLQQSIHVQWNLSNPDRLEGCPDFRGCKAHKRGIWGKKSV